MRASPSTGTRAPTRHIDGEAPRRKGLRACRRPRGTRPGAGRRIARRRERSLPGWQEVPMAQALAALSAGVKSPWCAFTYLLHN